MKRALTLVAALGLVTLTGGASPSGCGATSTSTTASASSSGSGGMGGSGSSAGLRLRARLTGFEETPAISTPGRGRLEGNLSDDGQMLTLTLDYADLKGNGVENGAVTGAHLHLGQRGVAGGVAIHLCGGGDGTAACPAPPATVTRTVTAANVVGPAGQGLAAGALADFLTAARAGVTYVNVHTTQFPTGEIRGQIRARPGEDEDEDHMEDD